MTPVAVTGPLLDTVTVKSSEALGETFDVPGEIVIDRYRLRIADTPANTALAPATLKLDVGVYEKVRIGLVIGPTLDVEKTPVSFGDHFAEVVIAEIDTVGIERLFAAEPVSAPRSVMRASAD